MILGATKTRKVPLTDMREDSLRKTEFEYEQVEVQMPSVLQGGNITDI